MVHTGTSDQPKRTRKHTKNKRTKRPPRPPTSQHSPREHPPLITKREGEHSSWISACEKAQDLTKALELSEDLQRQGIKPTIVTYSALTSTCEKCRDLTQALRLCVDVRREGIKLDIVTYNALTSTCEKG